LTQIYKTVTEMKTKKLTFLALSICIALILSYIEAILPPISAQVPGIKMGLGNIIIVFVLYRYSLKEAAIVSACRLTISSLLFSNPVTFVYGAAGALLSLLVMALFKKLNFLSTVGVSVLGAVCHNLGQIIVAMLFLKTIEIGYYMIILTLTGTIAGILIGLCAAYLTRALKNIGD